MFLNMNIKLNKSDESVLILVLFFPTVPIIINKRDKKHRAPWVRVKRPRFWFGRFGVQIPVRTVVGRGFFQRFSSLVLWTHTQGSKCCFYSDHILLKYSNLRVSHSRETSFNEESLPRVETRSSHNRVIGFPINPLSFFFKFLFNYILKFKNFPFISIVVMSNYTVKFNK
jgi:hypothetical protein